MSGYYLHELEEDKTLVGLLNSILSKTKQEIVVFRTANGGASSYLKTSSITDRAFGRIVNIYEFPGNCSSIVVTGVQSALGEFEYSSRVDGLIINLENLFSGLEKVSSAIGYARIFLSVTFPVEHPGYKFLVEHGYTPIGDSLHNFHSGNENQFFCKDVKYDPSILDLDEDDEEEGYED